MNEVPQSLPYLHRFRNAAGNLARTILVAVIVILVLAAIGGFWYLIFWWTGHLFGAW